MKLLSRTEEFILLAVIFLKEKAYAVAIRKRLKEVTGQSWSYGALFTSLEQMVKKTILNHISQNRYMKGAGEEREFIKLRKPGGRLFRKSRKWGT